MDINIIIIPNRLSFTDLYCQRKCKSMECSQAVGPDALVLECFKYLHMYIYFLYIWYLIHKIYIHDVFLEIGDFFLFFIFKWKKKRKWEWVSERVSEWETWALLSLRWMPFLYIVWQSTSQVEFLPIVFYTFMGYDIKEKKSK